MKEINKETLRQLRQEINTALEELGRRHGLQLAAGNCTFGEGYATFKLQVNQVGAARDQYSKEAEAFRVNATLFGLKPEMLGATIKVGTVDHKIIGMMPGRKYPVVLRRETDGKSYLYAANIIAATYNAQHPTPTA